MSGAHRRLGASLCAAVLLGCARLPTVPFDAGARGDDVAEPDASAPPTLVGISAAQGHVCVVDAEEGVWCWGANLHRQAAPELGDTVVPRPRRVVGVRAVEVAAGWGRTCARSAEGTVQCWGLTGAPPAIPGGPEPTNAPTMVPGLVDARGLAVSEGVNCARREGGALACWVGADPAAEPFASLGAVRAVRASRAAVCALRVDGRVACFGRNDLGQRGATVAADDRGFNLVDGVDDAAWLTMGGAHACVVDGAGGLRCWGHNANGQLMAGSVHDAFRAVPSVLTSEAAEAWAGGDATFARLRDGRWMVSGANDAQQLQLADVREQVLPRATLDALGASVVSLAVGESFACALLDDRTVRCWGSNAFGALGTGAAGGSTARPTAPRW